MRISDWGSDVCSSDLAGGEQGVVARLLAVLGEVHAGGTRHVLVDHVVDAPGRALGLHAERLRDPPHRRAGGGEVDPHLAAEEDVGLEISPQQVRIRAGRLGAAAAVAGEAGLGPGTLRAYLPPAP